MSQQTPLYIRGLTEKELADLQSFAKERGYADRSAYCRQLLRDALQQEYVVICVTVRKIDAGSARSGVKNVNGF